MYRHFNDSGEKNYGPLILQAHIMDSNVSITEKFTKKAKC